MALIAVTGGIGTGKTTIARLFHELGADTADADDIAHAAYLPGSRLHGEMLARWGSGILASNGEIDRKAVAAIVFGDAAELAWLEGMVHPFVRDELRRLSEGRPLFCAIPLLDESGWREDCSCVVSAWCPPDVQMARLLDRGWSIEDAELRLAAQASSDAKLQRADYGIVTSCSWECLREQCRRVLKAVLDGIVE